MKKLLNLFVKFLNLILCHWDFVIDYKKLKRLAITNRVNLTLNRFD